MKNILAALVEAKQEFSNIKKDCVNPFHKNKYASLDSILSSVEPALLNNGLVISHTINDNCLSTKLWHVSGEYLVSEMIMAPVADPQKMGSIITYYRRYAVCALLSVTADEDDDGEKAKLPAASTVAAKVANAAKVASTAKAELPPPPNAVAALPATSEIDDLRNFFMQRSREIGVTDLKKWVVDNMAGLSSAKWTVEQWAEAVCKLETAAVV